jgi:hypothetical protein
MGARQKKSKKPSGTNAERQLNESTFYTDECLGRHVGEALRAAGWKVVLYFDCFKEPGAEDVVWLPMVGAKQWVALTKDKAIRRKPWEREKVIEHGVRMFTLPNGSMSAEEMVQAFLGSRLKMGRVLHRYGWPFVAQVTGHDVTILLDRPPPDRHDE